MSPVKTSPAAVDNSPDGLHSHTNTHPAESPSMRHQGARGSSVEELMRMPDIAVQATPYATSHAPERLRRIVRAKSPASVWLAGVAVALEAL